MSSRQRRNDAERVAIDCRIETAARRSRLEDLLERGRWPRGVELTSHDRDEIRRSVERLTERLERLT